MKSINIFLFSAALLAVSFDGSAQDTTKVDKLTKRVEITKQYSPTIGSAIKHDITPEEVVQVVLESPKFDYSIAYKPQAYMPEISALESFRINSLDYRRIYNGYAEVALGYPFQSKANAYYTTNPKDNLFIAGGINHYGFWSKLENDMAIKNSASQTQNKLFGAINYTKNNFILSGDLSYEYDSYNAYGNYMPFVTPDHLFAPIKNTFSRADFNIGASTPYKISNKWDGNFSTYANFFNDNHSFSESFINLTGGFAKGFGSSGSHRIAFDLQYNYHRIKEKGMEGLITSYLVPSIGYRYISERSEFNAGFGVKLVFNPMGSHHYDSPPFLPTLTYKYKLKRVTFSLGLRSSYEYNTYNLLSKVNPYLLPGSTLDASTTIEAFGKVDGTIGTGLSWGIDGGYRMANDIPIFYNTQEGNLFTVRQEIGRYGFANVYFSALLMDKLTAKLEYGFSSFEMYTVAKHELKASVLWQITDRWMAKCRVEMLSSRAFAGLYNNINPDGYRYGVENTVPTKAELSLGGEFKINKMFSATLDLNNIFNTKMYRFNHYCGQGFNAMVGVTAKF